MQDVCAAHNPDFFCFSPQNGLLPAKIRIPRINGPNDLATEVNDNFELRATCAAYHLLFGNWVFLRAGQWMVPVYTVVRVLGQYYLHHPTHGNVFVVLT